MKKSICFILLALLMLASSALAQEAADITKQCRITQVGQKDADIFALRDRNERSSLFARDGEEYIFQVTPPETAAAAVYIEFGEDRVLPFRVEISDGAEGWRVAADYPDSRFPQASLSFPAQSGDFRLVFYSPEGKKKLAVTELYILSEGDVTSDYDHVWQPAVEKADLLLLATHPDDEILWFAGTLPWYAGQCGLQVQVAYLTCGMYQRQLELLNGLWHCGVHAFPDIGDLYDYPFETTRQVYSNWGRDTADIRIVRLLRRYRPEVVLGQDLLGEYGHPEHIVCAEALLRAAELAADPAYDPESAAEYGAWQVKKVYLHLGEGPYTVMDWQQPLSAFGGKTGFQIAEEAFQKHVSQQKQFYVPPRGDRYDASLFTLRFSTVGPDEQANDFLEHIPADALSAAYPIE